VHHSVSDFGNGEIFNTWHREKGLRFGMAYHFVIGNGNQLGDGFVETGLRWEKQLWGAHLKNIKKNYWAIGICLVGNFEQTQPTNYQYTSLLSLVSDLKHKYGIDIDSIRGHNEMPREKTLCPGKNLNMDGLRDKLLTI